MLFDMLLSAVEVVMPDTDNSHDAAISRRIEKEKTMKVVLTKELEQRILEADECIGLGIQYESFGIGEVDDLVQLLAFNIRDGQIKAEE